MIASAAVDAAAAAANSCGESKIQLACVLETDKYSKRLGNGQSVDRVFFSIMHEICQARTAVSLSSLILVKSLHQTVQRPGEFKGLPDRKGLESISISSPRRISISASPDADLIVYA